MKKSAKSEKERLILRLEVLWISSEERSRIRQSGITGSKQVVNNVLTLYKSVELKFG